MHPVLEEIMRARLPIREEVLRRWQHALRSDVGPMIEALKEKASARKVKTEAA